MKFSKDLVLFAVICSMLQINNVSAAMKTPKPQTTNVRSNSATIQTIPQIAYTVDMISLLPDNVILEILTSSCNPKNSALDTVRTVARFAKVNSRVKNLTNKFISENIIESGLKGLRFFILTKYGEKIHRIEDFKSDIRIKLGRMSLLDLVCEIAMDPRFGNYIDENGLNQTGIRYIKNSLKFIQNNYPNALNTADINLVRPLEKTIFKYYQSKAENNEQKAKGWLQITELLLQNGASPNFLMSLNYGLPTLFKSLLRKKSCPLYFMTLYAYENDNFDPENISPLITVFMRNKATIDITDDKGVFPLIDLINKFNNLAPTDTKKASLEKIIKFFIENNANLNVTTPDSDSVLHLLIQSKNYDLAALFLNKGANPQVINRRSETPLSILLTAAKRNWEIQHINWEVVADDGIQILRTNTNYEIDEKSDALIKQLLALDSNPNIQMIDGKTLVEGLIDIFLQNHKMFLKNLDLNIPRNAPKFKKDQIIADREKIMNSVLSNKLEIIESFFKHGAQIPTPRLEQYIKNIQIFNETNHSALSEKLLQILKEKR